MNDLDFVVGDLVVWDLKQRTENITKRVKSDRRYYGPGPFKVVSIRKPPGMLKFAADQVVQVLTPRGRRDFLSNYFKLHSGSSVRMKSRAWKGVNLVSVS